MEGVRLSFIGTLPKKYVRIPFLGIFPILKSLLNLNWNAKEFLEKDLTL